MVKPRETKSICQFFCGLPHIIGQFEELFLHLIQEMVSVNQAIEAKRYHRKLRKQAFEVSLRYGKNDILNKDEFSLGFKKQIVNSRLSNKAPI